MKWIREIASRIAEETEGLHVCLAESTQLRASFLAILQAAKDISASSHHAVTSQGLQDLITSSHQSMRNAHGSELFMFRRIHTDACILQALLETFVGENTRAISLLDRGIIISGAAGEGRLELIHEAIQKIQSTMISAVTKPRQDLPSSTVLVVVENPLLLSAKSAIPSIVAPSFLSFQSTFSRWPFIVSGYANDWPALQQHPWRSMTYLRSVSGPGRVVPVEIGKHYLLETWSQAIMAWDEFLASLDSETQASTSRSEIYYLAQHDLFMQFPALRDDVIIPDYAYATLTHDHYPNYTPPTTREQLISNSWLGPKGTVSPAHIDPYNNLYVQVVGQKTIWLAPPSVSAIMKPQPLDAPCLKNTSRHDVFAQEFQRSFQCGVVPKAMSATLNPGDLLYIPAGWWHAMKSEDVSFSVSFWF